MSEKYAQMGSSGDGMKTGDDKVKDVAEAWGRLKVLCVVCVSFSFKMLKAVHL